MANIKVNELKKINPAGTELFVDSESFINELSAEEQMILGGVDSPIITEPKPGYCLP